MNVLPYFRRQTVESFIYAIVLMALNFSWVSPGMAASSQLKVVNYITWWSLDPIGYHPAVLLKVENNSTADLTGQAIHFQGRFLNLRTTDINVARKDSRCGFAPHQRVLMELVGPDAYELPINSAEWPQLECKVMCRVGDVGDDGTQTLVITEVEREAMSDDEARQNLEKLHEYSQIASPNGAQTTRNKRLAAPMASSSADDAGSKN
jgi:hypothetical protein